MPRIHVMNEFGPLREIVLCEPRPVRIGRPINAVQRHFFKEDPPELSRIPTEYAPWVEHFRAAGIVTHWLAPDERLPSQMYTRDVMFAIGERLFVSNLVQATRQPETGVAIEWLERIGISYERIPDGLIEGGDVLVHAPYVFVGIGERTTRGGATALAKLLGDAWQVITIRLADGLLHLDCAMTIVDQDTIIWTPSLLKEQHDTLQEKFPRQIVMTEEESFHMAVNVLVTAPKQVCVEARHTRLQQALSGLGFSVQVFDWTEIRKLGGLFRCATCPLVRAL